MLSLYLLVVSFALVLPLSLSLSFALALSESASLNVPAFKVAASYISESEIDSPRES